MALRNTLLLSLAVVLSASPAWAKKKKRKQADSVADTSADTGKGGAAPSAGNGLSKELIQGVVNQHKPDLRKCYDKLLAGNPKATGRLLVTFQVDEGGTATNAAVAEDNLHDEALGQCVVAAVQTWPFPAPRGGGTVAVSYPFFFNPKTLPAK